jgi:hypothetical protein
MDTEPTKSTKPKEESDSDDDIAKCPVLKDKFDSLSPEQRQQMKSKYEEIVKPMLKKKAQELKEEDKKETKPKTDPSKPKEKKQHPRFEEYRQAQGGCPVMGQSIHSC